LCTGRVDNKWGPELEKGTAPRKLGSIGASIRRGVKDIVKMNSKKESKDSSRAMIFFHGTCAIQAERRRVLEKKIQGLGIIGPPEGIEKE